MSLISTEASAQPAAIPVRVLPYRNAHALLSGLIVSMGILDAVWLRVSPTHLDPAFLWKIAPIGLCLWLLWGFYTFIRRVPQISVLVLAALELLFFSYCGGILSYLLMGAGWPWQDRLFDSWDKFLGFDWMAYTAFIEKQTWLYTALGYLYQSTIGQITCMVVILSFIRRFRTLADLLGLIILGGIATIVIGARLPALGGYAYFNLPNHERLSYVAATAAAHDGTLTVLDPRHLEGIVAFPSYHTYLSITLIISSWSIPYLRYPMFVGNLLLLIGVPVFGGHYLVDMIAGAILVAVIYWIWQYLTTILTVRNTDFSRTSA